MGKADLHIHSHYSDGMHSVSEILEYVQEETNLDLIAIADHDMIEGALEAQRLAEEGNYRFRVIVGMEVTTREGHLLAYDIKERLPMLLPAAQAVEIVKAQGGFCVAPHPMSWLIWSLGMGSLKRLRADLAGIEVLSATLAGQVAHPQVRKANSQELQLAELGGSDAHFREFIGKGYTEFPGKTKEDFLRALREKTTVAQGSFPTREEQTALATRALPHLWRSLFVLPGRHLRRAWNSLFETRER